MTWHPGSTLPVGLLILLLGQPAMSQTVTVNTRDQIVKAVEEAVPGTTILIAPGKYQGGLHFDGLRGEQGKPIILAAADKAKPPIFEGNNSCFHLTDPAFVELHNLVLTEASGNGINIDDGATYETPAHHVVLRGLTIRDVGPEGNRDGIKLSGLDDFRVEDCTIDRWGDSGSAIDMVGCPDGAVVGCTFRYRSDVEANGVQAKGGSGDIVIQRCRFENAGGRSVNIGGSTGLQLVSFQTLTTGIFWALSDNECLRIAYGVAMPKKKDSKRVASSPLAVYSCFGSASLKDKLPL